ncbi:MAG: hypothetical protein U0Z53_28980 [Blastocatellia bacterium]
MKKRKRKYLSAEDFACLEESLNEALQHARGERADLRVTVRERPAPRRGRTGECKVRPDNGSTG